MTALNVNIDNCRYKAMIGVGGVGSGSFFLLDGNHTLGREESRSGSFIDQKDYCKLHIISHYVQILLGTDFKVIPLGLVGDDDIGKKLKDEMRETGMILDSMETSQGSPTLFSFCFIYPDGSGGNMTTNDSASSKVDAAFVETARSKFEQYAGQGIALAAPEVSLEARKKVLELASDYNFFRVASFTSEEMTSVVESDFIRRTDLLAINLDEAAAAVGMSAENNSPISIVESAVNKLRSMNDNLLISITNGKNGSWSWSGTELHHVPVHTVDVKSTAGAGDAHLAGLIVGLTDGLSITEAQQLATLIGSLSVTSPHTINKSVDRESLRQLANNSKEVIDNKIYYLLEK